MGQNGSGIEVTIYWLHYSKLIKKRQWKYTTTFCKSCRLWFDNSVFIAPVSVEVNSKCITLQTLARYRGVMTSTLSDVLQKSYAHPVVLLPWSWMQLCALETVLCDGSSYTSKDNAHCPPKQSWSAVCSQPRALSLQPLSEANQLVLPVLAQTVTWTSELLVPASAVTAQRISKQQ